MPKQNVVIKFQGGRMNDEQRKEFIEALNAMQDAEIEYQKQQQEAKK